MNALEWNRDLRQPVSAIRDREKWMTDKLDRGKNTVSIPELRKASAGLVIATQIARYVEPGQTLPGWHSPEQAWAQTQGQLAWYRAMEEAGELVQITDIPSLDTHLARWMNETKRNTLPIGYILSLEGADSLVTLQHLEKAYHYGLRLIGPAHYGPGRYANGTNASGKMQAAGLALLKEMERLHLILDVTHLCDEAFWQALENFGGTVIASHNNCRSLVPHNRQFSDEQLKALFEREAVIGIALDAWMIVPGWTRGTSTPQSTGCTLEKLADHIDHICQLAGTTRHLGIGTDLDGGYGFEQTPAEINTIADLQQIIPILQRRGYQQTDLTGLFHENWIRLIRKAWST
jgi:membrane dipeptidase